MTWKTVGQTVSVTVSIFACYIMAYGWYYDYQLVGLLSIFTYGISLLIWDWYDPKKY